MAIHTIEPDGSTVHGHFSKDLLPILEINSGDTVRFRTLEAGWSLEPPPKAGAGSATRIEPRVEGKDDGHCLCGPVAVCGAEPGMSLEIGIDRILPGTWGWSGAGARSELAIDEDGWLPYLWQLDAAAMTGEDNDGHKLSLRPFLGVMGMPPDEPGDHGTGPPRHCGGNLDCKELVTGTRLFLPVAVTGGAVLRRGRVRRAGRRRGVRRQRHPWCARSAARRGAPMRLSEALRAERIVLDMKAQTKDEAIAELITVAAAGSDMNETPARLLSLVLEREALTSTAVDKGVAIPHARSPQIEGVVVSLGVHRQGLDFGGPDSDPVYLVFLVLSADTATGAYLSVLGRTARIFRRPQMLQSVLDASNVDDILQSIADHEPI